MRNSHPPDRGQEIKRHYDGTLRDVQDELKQVQASACTPPPSLPAHSHYSSAQQRTAAYSGAQRRTAAHSGVQQRTYLEARRRHQTSSHR